MKISLSTGRPVIRLVGPTLSVQDCRDVFMAYKYQESIRLDGLRQRLEAFTDRKLYAPKLYNEGFRKVARWDTETGSVELWVGYQTDANHENHPIADLRVTTGAVQSWFECAIQ